MKTVEFKLLDLVCSSREGVNDSIILEVVETHEMLGTGQFKGKVILVNNIFDKVLLGKTYTLDTEFWQLISNEQRLNIAEQ